MLKTAILIEDKYQVLEVWYPYLNLQGAGKEPVLVGSGRKEVFSSKEGYPAETGVSIQNVRAEEFSCVIIPGGYAPDLMRRSPDMVEFVRNMFEEGKCVAAICHGPWLAASAGILKGRKATCFSAIQDDIINAGARYLDAEVVVDNNLITSRKPSDLPAFCREILSFIERRE